MVDTLIQLVVYLVIAGLIWWAVSTVINAIPIPEPIRTVVNVIMTVVICLIVLYALLGLVGHIPRLSAR